MKTILVILASHIMMALSVHAQAPLVFSMADDAVSKVSEKVLQEAYQRVGIQIQIKTFPGERAIQMANTGATDGEVNRIRGIEKMYSNLAMAPVAVTVVEGVVFAKSFDFHVAGWDSLKPYRIGIRIGTKFAERGTQGMNVEPVGDNKMLLMKLDAGRNDVIVTARIEGLSQIRQLRLQGIKILEPPLATLNLYHYLNKKHTSLIPNLTKVLSEMESEGMIRAIREQAIEDLLAPTD